MTVPVPAARPAPFDASSFLSTWLPRGDGLSQQDWQIRHTLLIWLIAAAPPTELLIAVLTDRADAAILVWTGLTALGLFVGAMVTNRRAASSAVALAAVASCAGLVQVFHGLTEAHFSFFVIVAALALYRDWTPFLVVLFGTVLHHAVAGAMFGHDVFDHQDAFAHPLRWAAIHGGFVLAAASMQVLGWQIAEVEQRRSATDLARAEGRFLVAFQHAPVAMILCDADGRVDQVNRALNWTMRASSDAEALAAFEQLTRGWAVGAFIDRLERGAQQIGSREVSRITADGDVQYLDVRAGAVRDDDGTLRSIMVHVVDVTAAHTHEQRLKRQIREDPLTKLLARPAFESDLRELLMLTGTASIVLVDIHRFTAVNDQYGRETGDALLKQVANRLSALAPVEALVARLAGDQFAIAVAGTEEQAQKLARGIVDVCRAPFPVPDGTVELTVVTGVSLAGSVEEIEQVLSGAEVAVERAKLSGSTVQLYDDGLRAATQRKINAELMLRDALAGDREERLPVWFQPIVSLETGNLVGAEALIRMRALNGELVPPGDFVPVAEETGLVVPMGDHVLQQALKYLIKWGNQLAYVSVNVSPRQLVSPDFVDTVARRVAESGLVDASRLVLEITETSLLGNTEEVRQRLNAIKKLGVRIALDDFGTGYSSLTWLQQVPADIVKLDRSFVAGLSSDTDKASIISAVIWLARSLNMSVVAEGVEEQADVDALVEADAGNAQGFLFSKPRDPEAFEELLAADGGVTSLAAIPTPTHAI